MQDIRIDTEGNHRCWKCGSKNFDEKRTFRSKALVGVGALMTHKKLKCQDCGEYNDTGHAKPFTGPAGTMADRIAASTDRMAASTAARNARIAASGDRIAASTADRNARSASMKAERLEKKVPFKEQVAANRAAIQAKKAAKKAAK